MADEPQERIIEIEGPGIHHREHVHLYPANQSMAEQPITLVVHLKSREKMLRLDRHYIHIDVVAGRLKVYD